MCKGYSFISAYVKILKLADLYFITITQMDDLVYLTFYFDVFHAFLKVILGLKCPAGRVGERASQG